MCTDDTPEQSTDVPVEISEAPPRPAAVPTPPGVHRRTFLKAAALGTAAAALLHRTESGGISLGPLTALANDLSNSPCTAQDVEIIGSGVVQNEPCSCTPGGTFSAHVQFTVRNTTSTGRYCISLHLPSGFGVPGQDVILRDKNGSSTAPGKSGGESFHDTVMFGDITGFPCNTGGTLVCIGQQGVTTGKCAPNTCTTIAWNTSPNAAGCTTADQNPPGGQCRHQGICIQGYGASLACKSGCTPTCGGAAVLTATVSGGVPPYVFNLAGSDGTSQKYPASGTTSDTSHDFTVTVTQNTTYTLTVTDSAGCSRAASTSLNAAPLAKPTFSAGMPDCAGKVTLTAAPSGLASYTWFDGATQIGTGSPLTATLAPGDHAITVTVTNSAGCSATSDPTSVHINQPVSVSASAGTPDCAGKVTLTASAGGGAGGYSFQWFDGASAIGAGNPLTVTLAPGDHAITVTATDSAGCSATSTAINVHINPPVSVSASAGTPDCTGSVALTASASGGAGGFTYQWFDGASSIGSGNPLTVTLAPGDHSITVQATDSAGCSATSTAVPVHVNQPVSTSLNCGTTPDCTGHLTFTASATGGTGTYTFAWTIDGNPVAANTSNTLAYAPIVDCNAHTVAVTATDSAGCVSGNTASRSVTQVVTTSISGC
ncbi:MAG: twin-arginine translocation signal domain-containing protein [Thermomicrobiales bacterium]